MSTPPQLSPVLRELRRRDPRVAAELEQRLLMAQAGEAEARRGTRRAVARALVALAVIVGLILVIRAIGPVGAH